VTEWLPVSSSGHLAIIQHYSGYEPPIFFDVMLHLGTALVVGILFKQDIIMVLRAIRDILKDIVKGKPIREAANLTLERRFASLLLIGSMPIMVVGMIFREIVVDSFSNMIVVGVSLIITGIIIWMSRHPRGEHEVEEISTRDALIVGIFQAAALLPGISRSGATISGGLMRGMSKIQAARFSFLLFFPAIIGATVLQLLEWDSSFSSSDVLPTLAGTITAMISGYLSIRFLLRLIQDDKFHWFSLYCWVLGAALLVHNIFF